MTAAIYYHPEAYTTSGPKLMGRHAAGESFLRGFLSHSKATEFWIQVSHPDHAQAFAQTASSLGRTERIRVVNANALGALAQAGTIYHPGPGINKHAWERAYFGHSAWSLCGITHTTASTRVMDAMVDLISAPVQPWDAVICTSAAVRDNVTRLFRAQADYLKDRLGISKLVLPQLPVIPLGIHTQDFAFTESQKSSARQALGADGDTLVVLFMGRLSFHGKAHPLAMYQALESAARQAGKKVILVECGWHANHHIEKAYAEAAGLACPNIKVISLDGRKPEQRQVAWAGADIFCSLSDNIQETFGITPIEAMAAGLPVVVSDWDGYKDTVRHEVDGYRIPTYMPEAGLGIDLAMRHALEIDTYDLYCGLTCSLVAVDIQAAEQAFVKLFTSPDLRAAMGDAGRQRASEYFDWSVIIPQYESLWTALNETRRAHASTSTSVLHAWPARPDPFYAFASYPTRALTPETWLVMVDPDPNAAIQRLNQYRGLAMVEFANASLPDDKELQQLLGTASQEPKPAQAWISAIPAERQAIVFRSLAWLVKLGILRVADNQ